MDIFKKLRISISDSESCFLTLPPTSFILDVLKKGSLNHMNIFIICGRTVGYFFSNTHVYGNLELESLAKLYSKHQLNNERHSQKKLKDPYHWTQLIASYLTISNLADSSVAPLLTQFRYVRKKYASI